MHPFFIWFLSLCFLLIANSCQTNQSKKFGLLSQLALSSQNKFFMKSPPKSRKTRCPGAGLMAELDNEAETSEGLNPTGQYENCLSPGLDCAISVLVSLDSQAEVEQGIFLREVFLFLNQREATCLYSTLCQNPKPQCCSSRKPHFPTYILSKFNW